MRRAEREIHSQDEIRAILARERVARVAFAVADEPYLVPLSYGYDRETHALFFHTATTGRKIQFIERNPRVCFEVEGASRAVPGPAACDWSLDYESVIGTGTLREVRDRDEKEHGLRCLMRQHGGDRTTWSFPEAQMAGTRVWRLDIETVTGKRATHRKDSRS